jgi:hypothetical protein
VFGGGCCFHLQEPRGPKIPEEFSKLFDADIGATYSSEMPVFVIYGIS